MWKSKDFLGAYRLLFLVLVGAKADAQKHNCKGAELHRGSSTSRTCFVEVGLMGSCGILRCGVGTQQSKHSKVFSGHLECYWQLQHNSCKLVTIPKQLEGICVLSKVKMILLSEYGGSLL